MCQHTQKFASKYLTLSENVCGVGVVPDGLSTELSNVLCRISEPPPTPSKTNRFIYL